MADGMKTFEDLEEDNRKLTQDYRTLKKSLNQIKKNLDDATAEVESLKQQLSENGDNETLKKQLKEKQDEVKKLLNELEIAIDKVEKSKLEIETLSSKIEGLAKENRNLKRQAKKAEQRATDAETVADAEKQARIEIEVNAAFADRAKEDTEKLYMQMSEDAAYLIRDAEIAREEAELAKEEAERRLNESGVEKVDMIRQSARKTSDQLKTTSRVAESRQQRIATLTGENANLVEENKTINQERAKDIYAHVVGLICDEFGVDKKANDAKSDLWKAIKAAEKEDKKAVNDYNRRKKIAENNKLTPPTFSYPNNGYVVKLGNVVSAYENYVSTLPKKDVEAFEASYVDTATVSDRTEVVEGVLGKIIDKEITVPKKNSKILKIVLVAGLSAVVAVSAVAIGTNVAKNAKLDDRNKTIVRVEDDLVVEQELAQLEGGVYYAQIGEGEKSLNVYNMQADTINTMFSSNSKNTRGLSFATVAEENVTGYGKTKLAVSEGKAIAADAKKANDAYLAAVENKDVETARAAEAELKGYAESMSSQVSKASEGVDEMLGNAGMTWDEVQDMIDLMKTPVVFIDVTADEVKKKNDLLVFNNRGVATEVLACQYSKQDNKVSILVECINTDKSKYLNYITFNTQNDYSVMDQYQMFEEMKSAKQTAVHYDKDLETSIEGTTIETTINGVAVSGVADLQYSITRNESKGAGQTTFKANAIVLIKNEEGEYVGSKMFEISKKYTGSKKVSEVEDELKQQLLNEINKELGLNATLVDEYEIEQ